MPRVERLLETALCVRDLSASVAFYQKVFGFELIASDDRFAALNVAGQQVLLLFLLGASNRPLPAPGGMIPPHDAYGRMHFAFAIEADELGPWRQRLAEQRIPVESEVRWTLGGTSLYFRDPDQHLVELATRGIWPIY